MSARLLGCAALLVVSRAVQLETAGNTSLGGNTSVVSWEAAPPCCLCTSSDDFEVHNATDKEQKKCIPGETFEGCTKLYGARDVDLHFAMKCDKTWFTLDNSIAFREIKFKKDVVSYHEARKVHFEDFMRLLLYPYQNQARLVSDAKAKEAEQKTSTCCICTDSTDSDSLKVQVHVHSPSFFDGKCRLNSLWGTTAKCTKLHEVPVPCSKSAFQNPEWDQVTDEHIHEARMVRFDDVKHVIQSQALMAQCAKQEVTREQASLLVDLASSANTELMGELRCKYPIDAGEICSALTNKEKFETFFGNRQKYACTFANYKKDTTWSAFTGGKPTQ